MRSLFLLSLFSLALYAQPAPSCPVTRGSSSAKVVQINLRKPGGITENALRSPANWSVSTILHSYTFNKKPIVVSQDTPPSKDTPGDFAIILTPDSDLDYTVGDATVRFTSASGGFEVTCHPQKISPDSRLPTLVEDPEDADITVTGALQSAVGDKPLYNYSIDAKYDVYSTGRHAIAAAFKAVASQQHNADPDSMKLAANYEYLKNLPLKWGMVVSSDLISYEFERSIKNDKPVALDKPIPKFIDKNSNRVHSAQLTFIRSTNFGSFFLRPVGIEGGAYITRSLHAASSEGQDTAILRGVFGADYYMFWKEKVHIHRIDFEVHHTQRVLHFAEPYARAGLNNGDQYLSRYARPISTAKLTFTIVDGFGLSFSYLRGSLPPTFEFVDHQLTIGLTILLKRK